MLFEENKYVVYRNFDLYFQHCVTVGTRYRMLGSLFT